MANGTDHPSWNKAMLRFRSLKSLIVISLVLMAAIPMAVIISISYRNAAASTQKATGDTLSTLASATLDVLYRNLFERIGDVQAFASSPDATGMQRDVLLGTANHLIRLYGLYDLMLICSPDGTVVAANSISFDGKPLPKAQSLIGTSCAQDAWLASALKQDVHNIQTDYGDLENSERVRSACGSDGLVLRFSTPIVHDGKIIGVWTNYASWDRIVRDALKGLLNPASPADGKLANLGFSEAELQILNRDGALLYDGAGGGSGGIKDYAPQTNLLTLGLKAAEAIHSASKTGKDAQGFTVEAHRRTGQMLVNSWARQNGALGFTFDRYNWGLLVRTPLEQVVAPVHQLLLVQLLVAVIALIAAALLAVRIANGIVGPIQAVETVMKALAGGDLSRTVTGHTSANEVGRLTHSVNTTIEQLRSMIDSIDQGARSLAMAAEALSTTAIQLVASSTESNTQANSVSAASTQISSNIDTVASSAEEMAASVKEISGNTSEASRIAQEASAQAGQSDAVVQRLAEASQAIGSVVQTISAIAGQTNLLALNATIEAARAGEAGRGFAVVASEVKNLAGQTSTATKDISSRISNIQADVEHTVAALKEISVTTHRIDQTQGTIASAVEEQAATTNEMTRNLTQASQGVAEISKQIQGVAASTQLVSQGAAETKRAAEELSRLADSLRTLVSKMRR